MVGIVLRAAAGVQEQRTLALLLAAAAGRICPEVCGRRVRVTPADAHFSRYARMKLEEGVRRGGGTVSEEGSATLSLEVRLAGTERADRNLIVPVGQSPGFPRATARRAGGSSRRPCGSKSRRAPRSGRYPGTGGTGRRTCFGCSGRSDGGG